MDWRTKIDEIKEKDEKQNQNQVALKQAYKKDVEINKEVKEQKKKD